MFSFIKSLLGQKKSKALPKALIVVNQTKLQNELRAEYEMVRNFAVRTAVDKLYPCGIDHRVSKGKIPVGEVIALSGQFGADHTIFRRELRTAVQEISELVPAWRKVDKKQQHKETFERLYDVMNDLMSKITNDKYNFENDVFDNQFKPAKRFEPAPVDRWRRINLCACSDFWRAMATWGLLRLTRVAVQDEAKRLGIRDAVEIEHGQLYFLNDTDLLRRKINGQVASALAKIKEGAA